MKKHSGLSCWNPVVLLKSCYPVEILLKIFESCSNPVQILLGKNAELATLETVIRLGGMRSYYISAHYFQICHRQYIEI